MCHSLCCVAHYAGTLYIIFFLYLVFKYYFSKNYHCFKGRYVMLCIMLTMAGAALTQLVVAPKSALGVGGSFRVTLALPRYVGISFFPCGRSCDRSRAGGAAADVSIFRSSSQIAEDLLDTAIPRISLARLCYRLQRFVSGFSSLCS